MKIEMAHGSGGIASAEIMKSIFGKHFSNQVLDKMEDAAVVKGSEMIVCSTDSFVVEPIIFKGGDIGKLSICGTVNDILMMGAEPKYITCGFILETGLQLETLEKVVESMAREAKKAGAIIIGGDTKVVEGKGGLYINTTGIGFLETEKNISASNCQDRDKIILTGTLGDHHATILSARMGIENQIKSDCATLGDITKKLQENNLNVKAMRDVTRGGLGTILNEIAMASECEILLEEEAIPIKEEVKGFADVLGIDPLYMGNEGKMILVIKEEEAQKALEEIRKTENGKDASIIGTVNKNKFKDSNGEVGKVLIKTYLGATRRVDVLVGEGLPRIC